MWVETKIFVSGLSRKLRFKLQKNVTKERNKCSSSRQSKLCENFAKILYMYSTVCLKNKEVCFSAARTLMISFSTAELGNTLQLSRQSDIVLYRQNTVASHITVQYCVETPNIFCLIACHRTLNTLLHCHIVVWSDIQILLHAHVCYIFPSFLYIQ